jgi:small-conductance mechanosensitive channel
MMKKVLVFTFFLVIGFAGAFAQQQKDSVKKVVVDSVSAYSKLSANQIFELEMEKADAQRRQSQANSGEVFFPVFGLFTGVIMLLIFTVFFYKVKQRRNEVFLKYAELGKDIPKEFLEGNLDRKTNSKLGKGIILACIGVGTILWLFTSGVPGSFGTLFSGVGFISLFTGIAYLIIHFIEKKQKQNDEPGR